MTEEQNKNVVTDTGRKVKNSRAKTDWKDFGIKPTPAFIGAAWLALGIGIISYCIGLWNASLALSEKGYFFTLILFGLFSAISVQKCVRDRVEGIDVTDIYYGISWFTTITSLILLCIGLRNAEMELSEKGFYGISFAFALFAAVAVQKNTRDMKIINKNLNSNIG
ncbi:MAG: YiaA/YiaB family protein [Flavobacteriales bacterium]|nr:YiaA/YiaB family protein [Flavobacteriales bacterium]